MATQHPTARRLARIALSTGRFAVIAASANVLACRLAGAAVFAYLRWDSGPLECAETTYTSVASPVGTLDARVGEEVCDCGFACHIWRRSVFVVPTGEAPSAADLVLSGADDEPGVRWESDSLLLVRRATGGAGRRLIAGPHGVSVLLEGPRPPEP